MDLSIVGTGFEDIDEYFQDGSQFREAAVEEDRGPQDLEFLEGGLSNGRPVLRDKAGFAYFELRENYWICGERTSTLKCNAAVRLNGDSFTKVGVHECRFTPEGLSLPERTLPEPRPSKIPGAIVDEVRLSDNAAATTVKAEPKNPLQQYVDRVHANSLFYGTPEDDSFENIDGLNSDEYTTQALKAAAIPLFREDRASSRFVILENASSRGNPLLGERTGYIYSLKKYELWVCTVRNAHTSCKAAVRVKMDGSITRIGYHSCAPRPNIIKSRAVAAEIKKLAIENRHLTSAQVLNEACRIFDYNLTDRMKRDNYMRLVRNTRCAVFKPDENEEDDLSFIDYRDIPGSIRRRKQSYKKLSQKAIDTILAAETAIWGSDASRYSWIENASTRGQTVLGDLAGYIYLRKRDDYWVCSVRNHSIQCYAGVRLKGDNLEEYVRTGVHMCEAKPGIIKARRVRAIAKQIASADHFRPASAIIKDILDQDNDPNYYPAMPKVSTLRRYANRVRESTRMAQPETLDFHLDLEQVPDDFLRSDITVGTRRHLVFASSDMLELLATAKCWYMDATLEVVRPPFKQLFTINAYIDEDEDSFSPIRKQSHLAFALMSGRKKKDYVKVLEALTECSGTIAATVKEVVLDFQKALWSATSEIFPQALQRWDYFHWSQALLRPLQALQLQEVYSNDEDTRTFLRKFFALPLLPAEVIPEKFEALNLEAQRSESASLMSFSEYVDNTWIRGEDWPPPTWCCFMRNTRTGEEVEGWYERLCHKNQRTGMYMLIQLLYQEAHNISPAAVRTVVGGSPPVKKYKKNDRYEEGMDEKHNEVLFALWNDFVNGDLTTSQLLRKCTNLIVV